MQKLSSCLLGVHRNKERRSAAGVRRFCCGFGLFVCLFVVERKGEIRFKHKEGRFRFFLFLFGNPRALKMTIAARKLLQILTK